jgi:hypothetical protein
MQRRFKSEFHNRILFGAIIIGLFAALIILPYQFISKAGDDSNSGEGLIPRTSSHAEGLENYDIRTDKSAFEKIGQFRGDSNKNAASVADIRADFVRGEEILRAKVPTLKVEYNSDIRTPEVITPDVWKATIEWLTPASGAKRSEILRGFVKENNSLIGVDDAQADALKVLADYTNPDGNLSFAHLEQRINKVPVFRSEIKAGFTKDGRIIRVINNLAPGLDYESLSTDFRNPLDAVKSAAGHINYELKKADLTRNEGASTDLKEVFGQSEWATTAEKMYFPTEPGVAVPAWRVLIWQPVNAYYVIVDAESGTMLWRKNITEDQTQAATYQVYNNSNAFMNAADSPAALSPGPVDPTLGTQAPVGMRTNVTLIGNEASNTFNNNGWITDGANITDGNAVEAGIDRDGINGVDAPQTGAPNRVFDSTWNPAPGAPAPGDDPLTAQAQRGAVIQMFYVMNRYHDELYKRGFTEAAFNFQNTNFTGMGVGNDRVSAEGQDSSGTNNANMSTPADGGRGRMQMYVWTGPTPDYDGTADAEVIIHEITHGLSNRLHGNASGLSTNMARGMGEGWGDWYAITLLSEPSDPINGIYTTGGYATYQISAGFTGNYYYGIRRFPRAPITFTGGSGNLPHNPQTFRYINAGCATLYNGSTSAFPRGVVGSATCDQVHNIGEIWSSMLWEIRNRMVMRLGHTAGTTRVLQVVTDGMKLAPIGPTLIQERDAIIAAAAALPAIPEASLDVVDVREGFRVRGLGFSASIQNAGTGANNTAVTEAYDNANVAMTNPFSVSDSTGDNDGFPEPGENVLLSVPVTNATGATVNSVMVNVNGGSNVSYGNVADGATVTMQIPYTISAAAVCGSLHTVTINVSSAIGTQIPQMRSFTLGAGVVSLTENFDGVTAPAVPAGWTAAVVQSGINFVTTTNNANSAPNAAFAADPTTVGGGTDLTSPVIAITSPGATVSFLNRYDTEGGWDGGVLEISIAGGAYQDIITAGGSFLQNGYTGALGANGVNNPLAGRNSWNGNSGGYLTSVVALPASAAGQNVQLKWRFGADDNTTGTGPNPGWYIDNISVVGAYNCSLAPNVKSRADYDGDGKTDLSVFRGSEGNWYLQRSTAGFTVTNFGITSDLTTPSDFDGDGKTDVAVFRPSSGTWFVLNSSTSTFTIVGFGSSGDVPQAGDYDGDGKADFAVFRPSTNVWYILKSGGGTTIAGFGAAGDVPIRADYNGDGKTDIAIFRPSTNQWWVANSGGAISVATFGASGDKLVPADYDGDNKDDIAVYRNGIWYIQPSSGGPVSIINFGLAADIPVPGDYDGDGKDDQAIYRNGTWWLNRSTAGVSSAPFGISTDIPTPARYIP